MKLYDPACIAFLCRTMPTERLRDPKTPRRFQTWPIQVVTPLSAIKDLIANELAGRARA